MPEYERRVAPVLYSQPLRERPHRSCSSKVLCDELFSAERARIARLLFERVEVGPSGADIRLRVEGLASLVRDLGVRTAA